MPKLLQINITANWGSTGKIAESIGIAAMRAGWESYVAYGRWYNPSKSHLIKIGECFDKYFHFVEQRIRDNEGLCSCRATRRLIRQIEEIKPDVVQLHNIHDHYLNYRILFGYLNQTSIKVVWTFHDCWAFTGHCFHFVTADCMRWQTGCHDCPMKNVMPKTLCDRSKDNYELKKLLFESCKNLTIVPCSDWMARFVKRSFLKDKRIEVIKNGVDLDVFKPLEKQNSNGQHKVLAVSSVWNKEKGLGDIYKLRDMLPENYGITIVGLTKKQVSALPKGIVGIERTQNVHELVKLYSAANVLINPTYADTFPTVNLEALACGTPVVTYETGGGPESITIETGSVVEQGDVAAMAEAIKRLMNLSDREFKLVRKSCRKRAVDYFDKDKCYEKYVRLYEEIVSKS
jgi:glycosyltransferase involved in cell wall biosynthesis